MSTGDYPTENEWLLLRLYRCMNQAERVRVMEFALRALGRRCSFTQSRVVNEELQEERSNGTLNERLQFSLPWSWPQQDVVDFGDFDNPELWFESFFDSEPPFEMLFACEDDRRWAEGMAYFYLESISKLDVYLPSDFDDQPKDGRWTEQDEALVRADFLRFLNHWRETILMTLEKQNPQPKTGTEADHSPDDRQCDR